MANTPGGGAVIVGVSDEGARIGTRLDADWLRHRIWELTSKQLTVTVREASLEECRILILTSIEALAPVRYRAKLRWRVGTNCVEVDPVVWQSRMLERIGFDWSEQPSGQTLGDVSPAAVEVARGYLGETSRESNNGLAHATDADLLRRLSLTKGSRELTNAGALLFAATPWPAVDYIRRDMPGGDSTLRIEGAGPLLVQVRQVEQGGRCRQPRHAHRCGLRARQNPGDPAEDVARGDCERACPSRLDGDRRHGRRACRRHVDSDVAWRIRRRRDTAEHHHHPAVPRYRNLAGAMASLGLAEREGIGVDRMVQDMLAMGRPAASHHRGGWALRSRRTAGGAAGHRRPRSGRWSFPAWAGNVDSLLLIEHLTQNAWVDARSATGVIQRSSAAEADDAIKRLADAHVDAAGSAPVISPVQGVPANQTAAYRLSDAVRARLAHRLDSLHTLEGREALALDWSRARGVSPRRRSRI